MRWRRRESPRPLLIRHDRAEVQANPTTSNPASIKLCTMYGLKYSHTNTDNDERKPQAFYKISRKEWFKRYRPGQAVKGRWEGKAVCRW